MAFEFDRYINGQLMAEGVTIERQGNLPDAMREAARIASRGPNGEVPVLVLRAEALSRTGAVKGEPTAFLVERLAGSGYGSPRTVIDAAKYDPRCDEFWIGDAKSRHLVTPLYALEPAAPEGGQEAARIGDAVLDWMVKFDLLDAGNEYYVSDVLAVLNDLTPSTRHSEQAVTEAMVEAAREIIHGARHVYSDEDLARAALKAAMEAGRHD